MNVEGINEKDQIIDLHKLLPDQGDSVMIVNCGDHYEIQHRTLKPPFLTEDDVDHLNAGTIRWH